MTPAYASTLGLRVRKTDIETKKIDESPLETFGMVIARFSLQDKLGRARFFQETFLLANTSMEVILGMPFLTLSGADFRFAESKLEWRSYNAAEALATTRRVEIINKMEFASGALYPEDETLVVHVASLSSIIHPSRKALIASVEVGEVTVPIEYSDFVDIFSSDSAAELLEHISINNHPIDLIKGQQPPYGPIYSLGPVELEILKTYIETNLASGFISPFMSPAGAPILFVCKKNRSLRVCVNYQGLNDLTIKNRYPLLSIGKSLDRLVRVNHFTQLDLTNAYHRMRIRDGDK